MRKKILGFLLVFLLTLTLVACGGNGNNGGSGGDDNGGGSNNGGGSGEKPTEVVIMHGAVHEVDPRHKDFSGREKAARIKLHEEVEKELNVKIVYKPYPPSAPWGDGRRDSIISWHIAGEAQADIYWLTTIWLAEIVKAKAVQPVNKWLSTYGDKIDDSFLDLTTLNDQVWGFGPETLTGERGLFYNTAMLEDMGLADPVDLWNNDQWTWEKFEELVTEAGTKTNDGQAVLGSYPSAYAESLIPLNGGTIVNVETGNVGFTAPAAQDVYTYLEGLSSKGLFETSPKFDKGSDAWANGDVLFHPGSLWFVRADNRWADFEFVKNGNIGVVPFPLPEGKTKKDYKIPLGGEAVYTIATNNDNKAKEELSFEVWNRIQLWDTEEELAQNFEDTLIKTFDDQKFVDVYMEIYKNVYFDVHEDIGISTYGGSAWQSKVNVGVKDGSTRSLVGEIESTYQNALDSYLGKTSSED